MQITGGKYSTGGTIFFTGLGDSDLDLYQGKLEEGIHYISDLGTSVSSIDSTVIKLSNNATFVIKFKE